MPCAMAERTQAPDNRAEIIEAAARAFMVNGYAGSSIDMVAEELGCTKGRIYYQFKGKADLFFDVQKEAMRMNIALVEPIATGKGSPRKRLQEMTERQVQLIMEQLPFQRVLVQGVEMHLEGSTTPSQRKVLDFLIAQRDRLEQLFVQVVKEGVRDGEFRKVDPRIFGKVLMGSIVWLTMWYKPRPDDTPAKRRKLARELADYMLNGLTGKA